MKNYIITATLSLIIILSIASCGGSKEKSNKDTTPTEQTDIAKYQCSMKCEGDKTYNKPGQCPVCNMNLEKVEAAKKEEGHDHNH